MSIAKFKNFKPNILVVGDLMLDRYLWGSADRISPEAPVPVVAVKKESETLGGAGNVANNLVSLGANVTMLSVVGNDETAQKVRSKLVGAGVKDELIIEEGRSTSLKTRIMATHSQMLRFDVESVVDIADSSIAGILQFCKNNLSSFDCLLLSDYKKGVLADHLTRELITMANALSIPVLADPKGKDYGKYSGATLLTPNKKEASEATGISINDEESLILAGMKLKNEINLKYSIITLSEDGIGIFDENKITKLPTLAREVYDVTGAGDTVLASLAFALSAKVDIVEACAFANKAAAVVVTKVGSDTASVDEIVAYENSEQKDGFEDKLVSLEEVVKLSARYKQKGKKVVFTNGCFDILHFGHVKYLSEAKKAGDILILGLNTDKSVRGLKGENRPINCEYDRAMVLAGLEAVDFVVLFDEETPLNLISQIVPNVLVKGADYKPEEIVGYDVVTQNGGCVKTIEFVEGKSTTKTIERIAKSV